MKRLMTKSIQFGKTDKGEKMAEKIWKIALGAAAGAVLVHVIAGAWGYLLAASLLVAIGAYGVYRYQETHKVS